MEFPPPEQRWKGLKRLEKPASRSETEKSKSIPAGVSSRGDKKPYSLLALGMTAAEELLGMTLLQQIR
jgi:hypothetical protein